MGTITRNFANNIVTGGKVDGTDGLTGTIPASNVNNDTLGNLTAFPATVGDFVEVTASDVPASPSTAGQLFYNSTSGTLKGISLGTAAWASGGNLNTGSSTRRGSGIQTAAIVFGGQPQPGQPSIGNTEQYDGSSWTEVNDLGTARYDGAPSTSGTQTATIYAGGSRQAPDVSAYNNTESWDGTSWTEVNNLNSSRSQLAGVGTQTAALAIGGNAPPPTTVNTESWDGTSWTEVNNLNTADRRYVGTGLQTAALAFGGKTAPNAKTEEWNGTSWTVGGSLNSGRAQGGAAGTQTNTVYFGGDSPPTYPTATELYDGTSWTTSPLTLTLGRQNIGGVGTGLSALGAGGYANTTPASNATEEWTGAQYVAKTLTTS